MKKEKSAGAVVYRKDPEIKYLILQYTAKHWDFPKGHIEAGETDHETVKRETEEETGITDIEIVNGFKHNINYFFKWEGELINKDVVFYLVKTETEKVTLSEEHIGFEWLSYAEAMKRVTFKSGKEVLEKAHEFLSKHKSLDEF